MAYQSNIPLATDQLSISQGDIQGNFQAIKALIDVNHVDFSQTGFGKHLFVEFPTGSSSGVTTSGPEVALYSNNGAISTVPELFFQRNNLGANGGYPATETGSETISSNAVYFTWLPSGLILKYGDAVTGGAGTGKASIALNSGTSGGPNYSNIFQIFISLNSYSQHITYSPASQNLTGYVYAITTASKTFGVATYLNGTLTNLPFSYFVIGS